MMVFKEKIQAISKMNDLGDQGLPFLFLIDFEMKKIIISTDLYDQDQIKFDINGKSNTAKSNRILGDYYFDVYPMKFSDYKLGFNKVMNEIKIGNSFLLNLTYPTRVMTDLSLDDIYQHTAARYKIKFQEEFVCYSPEIFVQIIDGRISSNPMKGTIDASLYNAESLILNDEKETAEHYTIVDLIRNDLSQIATDVKVDQFRYIDHIKTNQKSLLQVSSKISGQLADNYTSHIGDIIFRLLPAGSISGAPKKKTLEVIRSAERQDRGYYTGICGLFDGRNLDSGVMIRYIENQNGDNYYRSGCGITSMSDLKSEYQEMIDKVYLPINQPDNPDLLPNHSSINE